MNLLVAAVMAGTLVAIVVQIANGDDPAWVGWTSLALAGGAILTAVVHTVPGARRLGARRDTLAVQAQLARAICRDHLLCLPAIATVLTIQLAFAA